MKTKTITVYVVTDYNYYDSCYGVEREAWQRVDELQNGVFDANIKCHEIEIKVPA